MIENVEGKETKYYNAPINIILLNISSEVKRWWRTGARKTAFGKRNDSKLGDDRRCDPLLFTALFINIICKFYSWLVYQTGGLNSYNEDIQ